MKKMIKAMGLMALVMTVVFALSSFSSGTNAGMSGEKSCTVTIKYSNGDPADNVTVSAFYSGLGGGSHDFKTNDDGVVTLTWEYHEITHLYIKGNKYEVSYSDGGSYSLTLKQKHKYD